MVCKTNVGGMSVEQALIKGTADATITASTVVKDAIGYGANGERIVGEFEGLQVKTFTLKQSENPKCFQNRQFDCGFRPCIVILRPTIMYNSGKTSGGAVDPKVFSPTNGTGYYNFGSGVMVSIQGINDGATGSGSAGVTEINDTGFKLSIATAAYYWTTTFCVEFEAIAISWK